MTRDEAIAHIEVLYPPDSTYPDTRALGQAMLQEARHVAGSDWRDEPVEVLVLLAELQLDRNQARTQRNP